MVIKTFQYVLQQNMKENYGDEVTGKNLRFIEFMEHLC